MSRGSVLAALLHLLLLPPGTVLLGLAALSCLAGLHPPARRLLRPRPLLLHLALLKLLTMAWPRLLPHPPAAPARVSYSPGSLANPASGTFRLMDRTNMTVLLEPGPGHCEASSLLLLVLSALGHTEERAALRGQVAARPRIAVVFLVAEAATAEDRQAVGAEHQQHGDLLQVAAAAASNPPSPR
jgi:hypothetical protein